MLTNKHKSNAPNGASVSPKIMRKKKKNETHDERMNRLIAEEEKAARPSRLKKFEEKTFWARGTIWVVIFAFFTIINIVKPDGDIKYVWHFGIWFPLTTIIVFWEGRKFFRIYKDLVIFNWTMDVLLVLGAHILYVYSTVYGFMNIDTPFYTYEAMWEGTAILIVVTNMGRRLDGRLRKSSLALYQKLSDIKNSKIIVVRDGKEVESRSREVAIGETVVVQRGGFVPIDASLNEDGVFNYASITGESKSVYLKKGDMVLSGSYNLGSNIRMTVTKLAKDSTISHIVNKIESLSESKPKMQALADKIIKYFIPTIFATSFLTFIVWLIIGYVGGIEPWSWIHTHNPFEAALMAGVAVMAIACPCALGIATPLVYTVSSMLASRSGIVVNEAKALEEMNRVTAIAFDKTGTITTDKLQVAKIHGDMSYLKVAKTLENNVKHPIAEAISQLKGELTTLDNKVTIEPKGVVAKWQGKTVAVRRYENDDPNMVVEKENTVVALYVDNKPKLVFEIKNELRPNVVETIKKLKKDKVKVVMISGDSAEVTANVAKQVGIDKFYANVSPNDKYEIIKELQKTEVVAFVGDGFNDSLAIKQTDVSIAFASGSDITNSLANFSVTNGNFESLEKILRLARMNKKNVVMALLYAFGFNIVFIPLAILLVIWPWVSALVMATSGILVTENAFVYKYYGMKKLKIKRLKEAKTEALNGASPELVPAPVTINKK